METIYNGNSKSGGTYKIVNRTNGKAYYGSAKCFQVRAAQHQRDLKTSKHGNKHLQSAWNLDGSDAFVFEVIQVVEGTKQNRLDAEQLLLDAHWDNCQNCYNVEKRAHSRENRKDRSPEASFKRRSLATKGRKHTEEAKHLMSQIHKALTSNSRMSGRKHTDKTKQKMSIASKGKAKSPEHVSKIREAAKKRGKPVLVTVIATGDQLWFPSLGETARILGLNPSNVCSVLNGRSKHKQTKGYRLTYA